jgi:hypothetical protein
VSRAEPPPFAAAHLPEKHLPMEQATLYVESSLSSMLLTHTPLGSRIAPGYRYSSRNATIGSTAPPAAPAANRRGKHK